MANSPVLFARNEHDPDVAQIFVYGVIGDGGIRAEDFVKLFNTFTVPTVIVQINSPGGSAFDAIGVYNFLRTSKKKVITHVQGLAASAAAVVAMAGQTVTIAESGSIMIHQASSIVLGTSQEMDGTKQALEKLDSQIAGIFAKKTGKPVAEITKMMQDETWFTAEEALADGFVDSIDGDTPETLNLAQANAGYFRNGKAL